MSVIEDKLGTLTNNESVFGFNIINENGEFTIKINLRGKESWPSFHQIDVGPYMNLHQALDEAIVVLQEHLSDCTLC